MSLKKTVAAALAFILLFTGCTRISEPAVSNVSTSESAESGNANREGSVADIADPPSLVSGGLREDKSVYSDTSELYDVVTMYLTVREGNAEDSTNHTWTEVNTYDTYYYHDLGIERYACEAILQVGDENGPKEGEFGYGETTPNATVKVRGQTSSRATQKNYKIRIKDGKGTYKDMQTIPLNKMPYDRLRFRNKLAFDLMQPIPQMTAIRTQFVHLYVKDETEGGSGEFVDYGLYTRMEQINRSWLESRGFDKRGYLYKIGEMFEWYAYDPIINYNSYEYISSPKTDEDTFEYYLETKGNDNPEKLQEVLKELNDYTIPTEEIIEKHFDVENISYYIAFHTLTGNNDVPARNLYIYSPLNSEKWYLFSWDCDRTFELRYNELIGQSDGVSWECGITKFTNAILLKRFLMVPEYRKAVDDAVNDLMANYLTEDIVAYHVKKYSEIVLPYLTGVDSLHWLGNLEGFQDVTSTLHKEIYENYKIYLDSLNRPWPFYVDIPESVDGRLKIDWGVSYDLDGEDITYTCILARDSGFTDVIAEESDIKVPEAYFDVNLAPGNYFIRVISKNESGYTQECFDYYNKDPNFKGKRYGCMSFIANADGTFSTDINKE